MDLESLERNYRFALPHLKEFSPADRSPLRHRSQGWAVGSAAVGIGEHTPLRLQTEGRHGVVLFAPIKGHIVTRQDDIVHDTRQHHDWVFFDNQPAKTETGHITGIMISLQQERLQSTVRVMRGDADPTMIGERTQVVMMSSGAGQRAAANLPLILLFAGEANRQWPQSIKPAEDAIYRFVGQALMTDADWTLRKLSHAREKQAIDVACGFMLSMLGEPVNLTEVEAVAGLGARTLQLAFQRHRGVSPLGWLKEQRLLLAKHLLTSRKSMGVGEVALTCGLNHFGRFAKDYLERFGHRPSEVSGHAP